MDFTKKGIKLSITLTPKQSESGGFVQPVFESAGADTVTLTGYRSSVTITKPGFPSQGGAQARLYGLSLSLMNKLSSLGRTPLKRNFNLISIAAGEPGAESTVFVGNMTEAYADLAGLPGGVFQIFSFAAAFGAVQSIPPTSYRGTVDVAVVMRGLASQMGLNFVNNGVSVMLSNPYYAGSALVQVKQAAEEARIECDCDNGILAIWPRDGSRSSAEAAVISPGQGLVGYPYSSGRGLMGLKCVFNPKVSYGSLVRVESSITPACGQWKVVNLTHEIESETPGGQWFTTLTLAPPFSQRVS
jgi:hypothetical protein